MKDKRALSLLVVDTGPLPGGVPGAEGPAEAPASPVSAPASPGSCDPGVALRARGDHTESTRRCPGTAAAPPAAVVVTATSSTHDRYAHLVKDQR